MTENRQHPRKAIQVAVAFQLGSGERVEASCRDISLGGMFVETDAPPPYGAEVIVFLSLPGLRAESALKSTVRWTQRGSGMGLQFSVMGARETHALVELLQSTTG